MEVCTMPLADLSSGARASAFTDDEQVDDRYEQATACEQHDARSRPYATPVPDSTLVDSSITLVLGHSDNRT
jgi:hypothetical protein